MTEKIGVNGVRGYHDRFINWAAKSVDREESEQAAIKEIYDRFPEELKDLKQRLKHDARILDRASARALALWLYLLLGGTVIGAVLHSQIATPVTLVLAYLIALVPSTLMLAYTLLLYHQRNNLARLWKKTLLDKGIGLIPLNRDFSEVV